MQAHTCNTHICTYIYTHTCIYMYTYTLHTYMYLYIIKPRRACAARVTVVVLCVCMYICTYVRALTSTSSICEAKARYQQISNDISKVFDSWISPIMFCSKVMARKLLFCCAGTVGPTTTKGPLDGTAFQASTLVACTEGPLHKEKYTYFALCFYFLGKLTRPRLVHCAHAAILRHTSPNHTHCRRVVYYHICACSGFLPRYTTVYTCLYYCYC